jgi:cholest-4-en-3-one 26-monooxygenase
MATIPSTNQQLSLDTLDIISDEHYQRNGYPHREWTYLRHHAPVFWYDRPNVDPFWAITKHADIIAISTQPKVFLNGPRLLIFPKTPGEGPPAGPQPFRHLLNMDPPEHAQYRGLINTRFTPRSVRKLEPEIDGIAKRVLDDVTSHVIDKVAGRNECDFVIDVSSKVPLAVIAELIGAPREDWDNLFKWTNETIGGSDPEFQQGASAGETLDRARMAMFQYFADLVSKRQKEPKDDLTSVIANAKLDGKPLEPFELLSYFFLLVVAGNETTRNATTGGLLAFIENPEQWERLRKNPALMKTAIEEIVRWTTPVIQFARTASEDTEVRGQKIRAGESVGLFYPSGNRDEEVFRDPFRFDIGRDPNPHVAFGIGEHFCLGANLARLELEVIFRQLVDRFEHFELTGEVERLRSSFVGGIKHMPVRFELRRSRN